MPANDDPGRLGRLPAQLLALTGGFAVVFAAVIAAYAAGERRVTLTAAEQRLASEATLLAEHSAATLQEAAMAIDLLEEQVGRAGEPGALSAADLQAIARAVAARFNQIASVFVVDAGGTLAASSAAPGRVPAVNVSDRDYFAHHRESAGRELHLGAPVRSRVTGEWRFFLTRRVDGPDGAFAGVVGAALAPSFYERFFRALELPDGKRAALFREDGLLVVQAPFDEAAMERDLPALRFGGAGEAPASGAFRVAELDGTDRWVGLRRVPGFAAVATVSVPADLVLEGWRRRALWQAGSATVLFAVIAGLALILARHGRRLQASLEARARLEAELVRTARLESLGVLAGGIAHDFKNLLGAVVANVEVARERLVASSTEAEALADARAAAQRADGLARQLLGFVEGAGPVRAAVSLPELVEESARFVLHGSRARLELRVEPGLRAAEADATQLGQVVQNLVLNAAQAMPGGGAIRVTARNRALEDGEAAAAALAAGAYVEIAVSDEGPGVAPEVAARVFDPFFSTKEGGHGLGLAMVDAIVRRQGGAVSLSSEPGRGATFRVLLPASDRAPAAAPAPAPAALPPGLRVLVVDDEPLLRSGAVRMLVHLGCEAEGASDGEEAVRRCRAARSAGWRFDAVIADVTIAGGLGGIELLDALRAVDPALRVILSSGWPEPARGEGEPRPAAWLAKPYTLDELRGALLAALPPGDRRGAG